MTDSTPPELPQLPICGEITPEHVAAFFSHLTEKRVEMFDLRKRPAVWAAYLREFTLEDFRCLARHAIEKGRLFPLEMSLAFMHQAKADRFASTCPTRQASTTTGKPPSEAASTSPTAAETTAAR